MKPDQHHGALSLAYAVHGACRTDDDPTIFIRRTMAAVDPFLRPVVANRLRDLFRGTRKGYTIDGTAVAAWLADEYRGPMPAAV